MKKYVGLDWTGEPFGADGIYGTVVVAVASVDRIDDCFAQLRQKWGKAANSELHGHHMSEQEILDTIESTASECRVVAALFDKGNLSPPMEAWEQSPAALTARPVLSHLLATDGIRKLWYDGGDIATKETQKAFKTALARESRVSNPAAHMDVKPLPSEKHSLIQLADVFAYALQRGERGAFKTQVLRNTVARLWKTEAHRIWWSGMDDLRPYL